MTDELLNWLLFGVTVITSIGSFIAYIFARLELHAQRKDTKELQHITSNLERELYRLNVERDQNIQRLYRARDVLIGYQKELKIAVAMQKLKAASATEIEMYLNHFVTIMACYSELSGLSLVIGDENLLSLIHELDVPMNDKETIRNAGLDLIVAKMHRRIYELIAEATKSPVM